MALHWDQRSCHLICAGDSEVIKIWDVETETKLTDLSTGVNASVTTLSMQAKGNNCTYKVIKLKLNTILFKFQEHYYILLSCNK